MVKVKVASVISKYPERAGFNHPMVKVKAVQKGGMEALQSCFNHPMVKVKVGHCDYCHYITEFQPPYGES